MVNLKVYLKSIVLNDNFALLPSFIISVFLLIAVYINNYIIDDYPSLTLRPPIPAKLPNITNNPDPISLPELLVEPIPQLQLNSTKNVTENNISAGLTSGLNTTQCEAKLQKITLQFQPKTNDLNTDSQAQLLSAINCFRNSHVKILGHSDSKGTTERKLEVSQLRAQMVKNYLITQAIPEVQLTAVGMSDKQPIADNDTAEGRAKNRRIQFVLEPLRR